MKPGKAVCAAFSPGLALADRALVFGVPGGRSNRLRARALARYRNTTYAMGLPTTTTTIAAASQLQLDSSSDDDDDDDFLLPLAFFAS